MEKITIASVALSGVNNQEGYKRDGEYYYVCLGALNVFNSSGAFYEAEASMPAFNKDAKFMRQVISGNIYGEDNHPVMEPWMTEADFYRRNEDLGMERRALFIRSIDFIPTERICNGLKVVEIWGWIKPFGDKGPQLKAALDDPYQNVCFSIRAWCLEKTVNGVKWYAIDEPLTFDWVQEPGISLANKFYVEYDHKVVNQALPRHMRVEGFHVEVKDQVISDLLRAKDVAKRSGKRIFATESYLESMVEKYRANGAGLNMAKGGLVDNPL